MSNWRLKSFPGWWIASALTLTGMVLLGDCSQAAEPEQKPVAPLQPDMVLSPVVTLLEENAQTLLAQLTNPTGDSGQGFVEKKVVFSGASGVKIIPMQRFHPGIPGWNFQITEKPKLGEYRYLRFAWKTDGCAGIMVQLHVQTAGWQIRYTAGIDPNNWGTKYVSDEPPSQWVVVTCDLYEDFGNQTITGIALTAFDGQAGYFDHIYLGRSIEELNRIDATLLRRGKEKELTAEQLELFWRNLASDSEQETYFALWRMVAAPNQVVPFLQQKLTVLPVGTETPQIRRWIRDLDDDQYQVRDAASRELARRLEAATALLEEALRGQPSLEARARIERLLALRGSPNSKRQRIEQAVRVLEYLETTPSTKLLEELAQGGGAAQAIAPARNALKRIDFRASD